MDENRKWEFRKLCSKDLFLMCKIIGKIGLKEFTACFDNEALKELISGEQEKGGNVAATVGISVALDIASVIAGNIPKCETEIFEMLANTSNLKRKEVEALGIAEFFEMIVDFVQKEEFRDFFKVAAGLIKRER